MYKNNKGITLLALCVTIAVMLILAGVVVNSLTGNNGLIKVARDTADNVAEEDEAGESQRNSIYSEITAQKDDLITTGAFVTDLQVTANNQTKTISATASVTNQEILSYTFYIKKTTYDDKAYVKIEKADKTTSTITKKVEEDAAYQIKVVAVNKEGKKGTAIQKIVVGDKLKLNVASTTGADLYPDVLLVTAESLENYIDYIQMPDGTKVTASSKYELKTTYNNTKNGPATFIVKDTAGNSKTITYNEQNIPDFTTEWTITEANTTVTVPLKGTTDVYIDYGDGTKENVTSQNPTHTYSNAGTYTMKISGKCDIFSSNSSSQSYLTGIKKWGCLENTSYSFSNCKKLVGTIPEPLESSFKNITSCSYMFGWCSGLTGTIPENLFANCPNVTNFSSTFCYCSGLTGTIPENLFVNCPNVTTFNGTFWQCSNLTGNIPESLFANCSNVTNFGITFASCSKITGQIPTKLFDSCLKVTGFASTFSGCNGLTGSIPGELFTNCSNVTSFSSVFSGCSGLTGSIPEELFANCPNVTVFTSAFGSCNGLTNIPENLFANCPNVTKFDFVFNNCSGLEGNIPDKLFANCLKVSDFQGAFNGCKSLTGSIPEKLFTNCPEVTNFQYTFGGCSGVTGSIPENLFINCKQVTNFGSTFSGCKGLTGNIPKNLFKNCQQVTSFKGTFWTCSGLTGSIPEDLFTNCPNVTDFSSTFFWCGKLTGNAPELWNRTNVTSSSGCFTNCSNLTNYSSIPSGWK